MAKQIEGVYERIMECAKEEFLEKGYVEASLRTIAAKADTSTNSIYVRFQGKEGLFSAIVQPAMDGMMSMFVEVQERFHTMDVQFQEKHVDQYTADEMLKMIDFIYDHFDVFKLLLDASCGTKYADFVDGLIRLEVEYTHKWFETVGLSMDTGRVRVKDLLHIVTTSFFEGLFEVVRHEMSREEAKEYITMLGRYHYAGFAAIFREKVC